MIGVSVAFLSTSGLAMAKNDKGHGKHGKSAAAMESREHEDAFDWFDDKSETTIKIRIGTGDREKIKSYIKKSYSKKCPSGLAKKNNGCLPPGIAKKYGVGRTLPHDVSFSDLPRDLLDLLNPAPRGYKYVQVDKDILLIGEASKKVIDAVTLLSAVGS